jgi:hypothetical protein
MLGTAAIVATGTTDRAHAAKADKRDFFYQDKPKDGKSCAICRLFIARDEGKGQCAVVEGPVSPNGWCIAFSPRVSGTAPS